MRLTYIHIHARYTSALESPCIHKVSCLDSSSSQERMRLLLPALSHLQGKKNAYSHTDRPEDTSSISLSSLPPSPSFCLSLSCFLSMFLFCTYRVYIHFLLQREAAPGLFHFSVLKESSAQGAFGLAEAEYHVQGREVNEKEGRL